MLSFGNTKGLKSHFEFKNTEVGHDKNTEVQKDLLERFVGRFNLLSATFQFLEIRFWSKPELR